MNRCARCGRPATGRLCPACQPNRASAATGFAPPSGAAIRRATTTPPAPTPPTSPRPFAFPRPPVPGHQNAMSSPNGAPASHPTPVRLLTTEPGTVASTPTSTVARPSLEDHLGPLAIALLVAVIVTNPVMASMLLWWLLIGLGLLWLLGRIGLLPGLGLLLALGRGRGSGAKWQPPAMTFRCQFAGQVRDVQVRGFDTGVQLGDQVDVSGPTLSGVVHATRVVNRTTGAVLRRHGLTRTVVLGALCAWLLVTLLAQLAS